MGLINFSQNFQRNIFGENLMKRVYSPWALEEMGLKEEREPDM